MMNASSVKENWHLLKSANNSKSCYIIILFILEWLCDEAFGFFFEFLTVFFFVTDRRDICFLCGIFLQKYICKVFFIDITGREIFKFLACQKNVLILFFHLIDN